MAPAGDKETAIAAINHGADAVYVGYSSFSARALAVNLDEQDLAEVISYAHCFGARVYVAMNTLVKDSELNSFLQVLLKIYALKADAVILQDPFLGKYIHERYPDICLHLSTQAGVNNVGGAKIAKEFGFSRVILARETPLAEIREIAKLIETEVFVQGALCTCYSGQCYLSGFVGDNSGNRGRCKQPCRKRYTYLDQNGEYSGYPLSLSDLSVGEDIQALLDAGVSSFKIEGRMRRAEYVVSAVRYYRDLLDGKDAKADFQALKRAYNRGDYTKGLSFGQDQSFISDKIQGHIGEKVGVLTIRKGRWLCKSAERGKVGDAYKIVRDGKEVSGGIFAENANDGFYLSGCKGWKEGDFVHITTDVSISSLIEKRRLKPLFLSLSFEAGKQPKARCKEVTIEGDFVILSAMKRALTEEEIVENFSKTDGYPYAVSLRIDLKEGCFLPKSELNAFRRKVFSALYEMDTMKIVKPYPFEPVSLPLSEKTERIVAVMGSEFTFESTVDLLIFKPYDYADAGELKRFFKYAKGHAKRTALYVPGFLNGADRNLVRSVAPLFDLLYVEGLEGLALSRELSMECLPGTGFNLTNSIQCAFFPEQRVLSKELDRKEQRALGGMTLTAGSLKVMDLLYCPFHKNCASCNQRHFYRLRDEEGRIFLLRRYRLSSCRFELFNCADLVTVQDFAGALYDFTTIKAQNAVLACQDLSLLKQILPSHTAGHFHHTVI